MKTNVNELGLDHQAQQLASAIDAEIRLMRYWMLSAIANFKELRHACNANRHSSKIAIAEIGRDLHGLVTRSMREYTRKQELLGNLEIEFPYLTAADLNFYHLANHYGPAIAQKFANDFANDNGDSNAS